MLLSRWERYLSSFDSASLDRGGVNRSSFFYDCWDLDRVEYVFFFSSGHCGWFLFYELFFISLFILIIIHHNQFGLLMKYFSYPLYPFIYLSTHIIPATPPRCALSRTPCTTCTHNSSAPQTSATLLPPESSPRRFRTATPTPNPPSTSPLAPPWSTCWPSLNFHIPIFSLSSTETLLCSGRTDCSQSKINQALFSSTCWAISLTPIPPP